DHHGQAERRQPAMALHAARKWFRVFVHKKAPLGAGLVRQRAAIIASRYFGWATTRRYGLSSFQPAGNSFFASSLDTDGTMMTSWPCFQFTGVATLCLSVSCSESITRRISSKLRPALAG